MGFLPIYLYPCIGLRWPLFVSMHWIVCASIFVSLYLVVCLYICTCIYLYIGLYLHLYLYPCIELFASIFVSLYWLFASIFVLVSLSWVVFDSIFVSLYWVVFACIPILLPVLRVVQNKDGQNIRSEINIDWKKSGSGNISKLFSNLLWIKKIAFHNLVIWCTLLLHVCMYVCMYVCLSVCLSVYIFGCLMTSYFSTSVLVA